MNIYELLPQLEIYCVGEHCRSIYVKHVSYRNNNTVDKLSCWNELQLSIQGRALPISTPFSSFSTS